MNLPNLPSLPNLTAVFVPKLSVTFVTFVTFVRFEKSGTGEGIYIERFHLGRPDLKLLDYRSETAHSIPALHHFL